MKYHFFLIQLIIFSVSVHAQQNVGIGTTMPNSSSVLDITSTTKGILIPRMTSAERTAIGSPATGLLVYDNTTQSFWYRSSTGWLNLQTSRTVSDADGDTKIQVEELPDEDIIRMDLSGTEMLVIQKNANNDLLIKPGGLENNIFIGRGSGNINTGYFNTVIGDSALHSNTLGFRNSAMGFLALYSNEGGSNNTASGTMSMYSNTEGHKNTASGSLTLYANFNGDENTAIGYGALSFNNTGSRNTGIGYTSLYDNFDGNDNNAFGHATLSNNIGGDYNSGFGSRALLENTTGSFNTASGYEALSENKTGNENTAIGYKVLHFNKAGSNATAIGTNAMYYANSASTPFTNYNVAVGYEALRGSPAPANNIGNHNTAIGYQTLLHNIGGSENSAVGRSALLNNTSGNNNVAIGFDAGGTQSTGSNCTFLGYSAEASTGTFTNAMAIGYQATVAGSNEIRIGNSSITEIGGYEPWTDLSDARFKKNISQNVHGLDFILKLRPVTYNLEVHKLAAYLKEDEHLDTSGSKIYKNPGASIQQARDQKELIAYSGFIAQEVETAANSIGYAFNGVVKPDNQDDLYGLQYSQFVVPLVKAMQEISAHNTNQEEIIQDLKSENAILLARIERLEALFDLKKN